MTVRAPRQRHLVRVDRVRAGVNSAPELECIANSNSGIAIIGIGLELPSLEYELELPSLEFELYSELKSDMMSLV